MTLPLPLAAALTLDVSTTTIAGGVATVALALVAFFAQRAIRDLDRRQDACDARTHELASEVADVRERLARVEPRPR